MDYKQRGENPQADKRSDSYIAKTAKKQFNQYVQRDYIQDVQGLVQLGKNKQQLLYW